MSVRVPGNRFQTSEAIGEIQRPWIGLGLAGMGKVLFTPNYSKTFFDEQNPDITYNSSLHVTGSAALTHRFDVGVLYNSDSSVGVVGKWQFLSHRFTDSLKLSSALALSVGVSGDDKNEESGRPSSVDMGLGLGDLGLLVGMRVSPAHLFYSGAFLCNMDYEGKQTLHSQTRDLDGSISCNTITYGWEFSTGENYRWILEGAATEIKTSDSTGTDPIYQKKRAIHTFGLKHSWRL